MEQKMNVFNTGDGTLKVDSMIAYADWISQIKPNSFTVSESNHQKVDVMVNAENLEEGNYYSKITTYSNGTNTTSYKTPVIINVVPLEKDIEVFPDTLKIDVQKEDYGYFYITNLGNERLKVSKIEYDKSIKWLKRVYPNRAIFYPLDTIKIKVEIYPDSMEHYSDIALITIYSDDPDESIVNVYINPYNYLGIVSDDSIPDHSFLSPLRIYNGDILYLDYGIPENGKVVFKLHDITGRTLFKKELNLKAGYHTFFYNIRDNKGRRLGKGLYFIEMRFEDKIFTRKAVIIR